MTHNLVYLKYKQLIVIAFAGLMLYSHSTYPSPAQESAQSSISLNPAFLDFELFSLQSSDEKITLTLAGNTVDLSQLKILLKIAREIPYDVFAYVDSEWKENITEQVINALCPRAKSPTDCISDSVQELQNIINETVGNRQDRISYPDLYTPIRGTSDSFEKAMNFLKSSDPCNTKCQHAPTMIATLQGSNQEYSMLRDKIKDKGKQCQQNILRGLSVMLDRQRLPEECLLEENKSHTVCSNMLKDLQTWQERITDIAEMAYGPDILSATSAQATCTDCESVNINEEIKDLPKLINDLEEQSQCSDPKPGEQKIVHSNTSVDKSYTVKREPDGSFSIPLYIDFSAGEDYDGEVPRNKVPAHYMAKAQQCLKKANTKMLGPNGEKLNIDIQPPPQNQSSACAKDIIPISIASTNHRSNAEKYASDINCATITHEVLHLTGLCDEYKERTQGFYVNPMTGDIAPGNNSEETAHTGDYEFKPAYDCRVINVPPPNIMANHNTKWRAVFDGNTREEEVSIVNPDTDTSLLTPGQFNAILYGSCKAKNESFNRCSQLAYQSSHEEPNCIEQKTQCSEQNAMGMNKSDTIRHITDRIETVNSNIDTLTRSFERWESKLPREQTEEQEQEYSGLRSRVRRAVQDYKNELSELQKRLETAKNWPDQ